MTEIVVGVLSCVWFSIGGIHLYWGFGGRKFSDRVLPEAAGSHPTPLMCFAVAPVFLGIAVLCLIAGEDHGRWVRIALGAVGTVCVARAVGDFKFMGFFKKHSGSLFAYWDSRLYSPLCLVLAAGLFFVAWGK